MTDDRMVDLETRLLYQERLLEQLNEAVTAQEGRLSALEAGVSRLAHRVTAAIEEASAAPAAADDEIPPHY